MSLHILLYILRMHDTMLSSSDLQNKLRKIYRKKTSFLLLIITESLKMVKGGYLQCVDLGGSWIVL